MSPEPKPNDPRKSGLYKQPVVIKTEDGLYVGMAPYGRIALHQDPRAAFVYDLVEDHVSVQIEEVKRLYQKVWIAVPIAHALRDVKPD